MPSQFSECQIGPVQRHFHDHAANRAWYPVPVTSRGLALIRRAIQSALLVSTVPMIKTGAAGLDLFQCPAHGQLGFLHQTDNRQFLGITPCPVRIFLSQSLRRYSSATACFSSLFSLLRPVTSSILASRTVSPDSHFLPASRKSLLQR